MNILCSLTWLTKDMPLETWRKNAFAVRQFAKDGHKFLLTQSFAKNMGLYGKDDCKLL